MSPVNSLFRYPHCRPIWDEIYAASLHTSEPITMHLDGKTDKYRDKLMFELYHWRNLLRKENARIHPKGHPSHGTSIFDPFTIHKGTDDNGNPTLTFKKQDT